MNDDVGLISTRYKQVVEHGTDGNSRSGNKESSKKTALDDDLAGLGV